MENPIKMDDLGGVFPLFSENIHIVPQSTMICCAKKNFEKSTHGSPVQIKSKELNAAVPLDWAKRVKAARTWYLPRSAKGFGTSYLAGN